MNNDLILATLLELKEIIDSHKYPYKITDKWIPRAEVMRFFSYGDTQINAFEKEHDIITTKVGKRKFFSKESLQKILEDNCNLSSR